MVIDFDEGIHGFVIVSFSSARIVGCHILLVRHGKYKMFLPLHAPELIVYMFTKL